ncbi:hypothetical protein GCM10010272_52400 [Streptomyces lateritius]|nr:hypothetical protein GCM10010272_52400 [Streptomyces lateritius]
MRGWQVTDAVTIPSARPRRRTRLDDQERKHDGRAELTGVKIHRSDDDRDDTASRLRRSRRTCQSSGQARGAAPKETSKRSHQMVTLVRPEGSTSAGTA